MELQEKEKEWLKKVATQAGVDEKVATRIFQSLLIYATINFIKGERNFCVPYVGNITLGKEEIIEKNEKGVKLSFPMEIDPSPLLVAEFSAILNDKEPPSKKFGKKIIMNKLSSIIAED